MAGRTSQLSRSDLVLWHIAAKGECAVCPELARADMGPFWRDSAYDPERTKTRSKYRSAASLTSYSPNRLIPCEAGFTLPAALAFRVLAHIELVREKRRNITSGVA